MATSYVTEQELAQAMRQAHLLETRLLLTRIERLTAIIREHGLLLPGEDPALGASDGDHLAACRSVVGAAYQLLEQAGELEQALAGLRRMIGSGMELVHPNNWKETDAAR